MTHFVHLCRYIMRSYIIRGTTSYARIMVIYIYIGAVFYSLMLTYGERNNGEQFESAIVLYIPQNRGRSKALFQYSVSF